MAELNIFLIICTCFGVYVLYISANNIYYAFEKHGDVNNGANSMLAVSADFGVSSYSIPGFASAGFDLAANKNVLLTDLKQKLVILGYMGSGKTNFILRSGTFGEKQKIFYNAHGVLSDYFMLNGVDTLSVNLLATQSLTETFRAVLDFDYEFSVNTHMFFTAQKHLAKYWHYDFNEPTELQRRLELNKLLLNSGKNESVSFHGFSQVEITTRIAEFTAQERTVIFLSMKDYTLRQIARRLSISPSAVSRIRGRIVKKLNQRNN